MDEKEQSVQYVYAIDSKGELTHANSANRQNKYFCPGCKGVLIPVLGLIKAKHFRHFQDSCSFETYLHKIAKEAFMASYSRALAEHKPISLQLSRLVVCKGEKARLLKNYNLKCEKVAPAKYDLTKLFGIAALEKFDAVNGFKPDILLSDSHAERVCYVEICVTHACSEEKKASGIPILEFRITNESDIQMLMRGEFSNDDSRITTYNFSPKPKELNRCEENCPLNSVDVSIWSLSDSGRLNETVSPLGEIQLENYSALQMLPKELPAEEIAKHLRDLMAQLDPIGRYQMCVRCRHGEEWLDGTMHCIKKAERVSYIEARRCADYEVIL